VEELSEIVHRGRNDYLIIRAVRELEDRNSNEVTDDLGINIDGMSCNGGLKYQTRGHHSAPPLGWHRRV
jgi:hypothetical protein